MTATRRSRAKAAQQSGTDVIPASEAQAIAALDEAKRQIDIARANEDVDTLLDWADRAAAVQIYIKRRDEAREVADNAGEIKVRAEAALGKLDLAARPTAGRPAKKDDTEGEDNSSDTEELEEAPSPLASFQTARRSAFRTLGKLEEKELDAVVKALREDDNEGGVTTSRAVRVAREFIPVEHRGANGSTTAGKPSKEQRKQLITDYVDHVRALDTEVSTLTRLAKKVVNIGTDSERTRIAKRLNATLERLAELTEFVEVGDEPEPEEEDEAVDGEVVEDDE